MEKHIAMLQASGFSDLASLEDHALECAVEETYRNTGKRWRPWAKNARSLRVGDIVLIVDADTNVPEASEFCMSRKGLSTNIKLITFSYLTFLDTGLLSRRRSRNG